MQVIVGLPAGFQGMSVLLQADGVWGKLKGYVGLGQAKAQESYDSARQAAGDAADKTTRTAQGYADEASSKAQRSAHDASEQGQSLWNKLVSSIFGHKVLLTAKGL